MDLRSALAQTETRKGPQCSVCKLIENPPNGVTPDELVDALNGDTQQAHLARAFALLTGDPRWSNRGQVIGTHRRIHAA